MISGEDLTKLWRQIVALEAECELTERWLERIGIERGRCSPEAMAASYRLEELKERLSEMDERCSAFLKSGDWMVE